MRTVRLGWCACALAGLLGACGGTGGEASTVTPGSGAGSGGSSGAGSSLAGSGGGSGTGSVAGGGGGPGRAEGPAQWLVFTTPDGFFAYDTHNYPNAAPPSAWVILLPTV